MQKQNANLGIPLPRCRAPKLPLPQIEPIIVTKIPAREFAIRGTSSAYVLKDGKISWSGICDRGKSYFYFVRPIEKDEYFWSVRFLATLSVACERAIDHCGVHIPHIISKPQFGLPALLVSEHTYPTFMPQYCEHRPNREQLEWTLLNGKAVPTFIESEQYEHPFRNSFVLEKRAKIKETKNGQIIQVCGERITDRIVQISQKEYFALLVKMDAIFRKFGSGYFEAEQKYLNTLEKTMRALEKGKIDEKKANKIFSQSRDVFYRSAKAKDVPEIMGHEMPRKLLETGAHAAYSAYSYVFGEMLKHSLVKKAYGALKLNGKA